MSDTPLEFGSVEPIEIQEEMERSFLDYAMSVIVSRALPDVRDGLKPVHRRILYDMFDQGFRPDRLHVKCARVTGNVVSRWHPHGTSAIYDALTRMAQPFSLRHPLIDFHGNYGSPDFDAAAERYTECRLSLLAMQLMAGIDEDTVNFIDNYSGEFQGPEVLPARFPNLLVNGSQGIAVGMATNIPPHNLGEVIDAVTHLIDNPDATPDELMQFVKGPDFPTGGSILGRAGIIDAYRTGRGSVRMRATAEIEEVKGGSQIVVTELPYQTSATAIAARIGELANEKTVEGIRAIDNFSAGDGTRLVIGLKRDANALVVLNNLYKHTPMQSELRDQHGRPRRRRASHVEPGVDADRVRRAPGRGHHPPFRVPPPQGTRSAHIVEGLLRALDVIDAIIALIRASDDRGAAREGLMAAPFEFSDVQANHILDLTLGRLTRLARHELEDEMAQLRETMAELEAILADDGKLRGVIKSELAEVRAEHATPRIARITHDPGEMNVEDLLDDKDLLVIMTRAGYIKSVDADAFRTQGRGGRGVAGGKLKEEDLVMRILHTSAHAYLLFFSNRGRVYRLRGARDPRARPHGKGHPDRQPAAACTRRAHPSDHRHARLRDEPLPLLRHQARPGQEDVVLRVRQVTP